MSQSWGSWIAKVVAETPGTPAPLRLAAFAVGVYMDPAARKSFQTMLTNSTTWVIQKRREYFGELTEVEQNCANTFMYYMCGGRQLSNPELLKIAMISGRKTQIMRQQDLLRRRTAALDRVRNYAKYQRKQELKRLGKMLLKRGLRSVLTHTVAHVCLPFVGTAMAHAVDATNATELAQTLSDMADMNDSVEVIVTTLDGFPDFDAIDYMQSTYGSIVNIDTFDCSTLDPSQLTQVSVDTNQWLSVLCDQNSAMEVAYNQYSSLFDSTPGVDSSLFRPQVHFGYDGRFSVPDLTAADGSPLISTASGVLLSKNDPSVVIDYADTKSK